MTLSEFKTQAIQYVKNNYTTNVICAVYPKDNGKQLTILMNGGQPATDMATFINGKISEIDAVETVINALTDQTILDDFVLSTSEIVNESVVVTLTTDAEQFDYVESALPSLTTTDQKLSIVSALRWLKMRG